MSGHTPVAMSWSIARRTSTSTPCLVMMAVLRSISPCVLLTSGDRFSVALMTSARRSSYRGSAVAAPGSVIPPSRGLVTAEVLDQVDLVVTVRVARCAPAFGVAEPGVEVRGLEGVGAQRHPVAAAAPDLGFGGGQHPGSQAAAALVAAHPEQLDVTAPAPGPAGQAGQQVAVVAADGDGQPEPVVVA